MIPYVLFMALLLIFWRIKSHRLMFLLLLLFSILRYDVGWDYMSYYETVTDFGSPEIAWDRYSFIWLALFEYAHRLRSPHLFLLVPAFINISLIYFCTLKFMETKKEVCNSLLVFACYPFFYLATMSTVRQNLSISIALLMLYLIKNKKIIYAIAILVLNYFIHPTSLISILFFSFGIPNFRISLKQIALIMISIVGLLGLLQIALEKLGILGYMVYFTEEDEFGSKLSILLIVISAFLIQAKRKTKNAINPFKGLLLDISIVALLAEATVFLASSFSTISRILSYFSIILIYVQMYVLSIGKYSNFIKKAAVICYVSLFFFYLITTNNPKKNTGAYSGFVPYKCILFENN